jgi:hypothetical protein
VKSYPSPKGWALLLLITLAAFIVHGYHPGVEDAEIYLPGIKKALNPALYPQNDTFFASHAHLTLFPNLIAASVRLTHVPLDWAILFWQLGSIFLLLLGCWHIGRLTFPGSLARWGGVALVAALLTMPVAGTALYIMDEYLTARSLSTPAVLFMIINSVEGKLKRAFLWAIFTAAIHPLMVVFGLAYVMFFWWAQRRETSEKKFASVPVAAAGVLLPFGFFPPVTQAYREVLNQRPYFFLLRWHWYEWLGIVAPFLLLAWYRSLARSRGLMRLAQMCIALILFGLIFFSSALVITIPDRLANLAELQPMRYLHLTYVLFLVFTGGFVAQNIFKNKAWRWAVFFLPLCLGMWYAQRQLFPSSEHLELPWRTPKNEWVRAFLWIRNNTPPNALFALNPDHMALPGEDQHGFRAIAERSRLADAVKDAGAVTMFPRGAETWLQQVNAQREWQRFEQSDFERLRSRYGVSWIVLQRPSVDGLACPYHSATLFVCRLE